MELNWKSITEKFPNICKLNSVLLNSQWGKEEFSRVIIKFELNKNEMQYGIFVEYKKKRTHKKVNSKQEEIITINEIQNRH